MKTIWKYRLQPYDVQILDLPIGAEILHVRVQDGEPHLWVMFDPTIFKREKRKFALVGTGSFFDNGDVYLGTVHCPPFVWHVFELTTNDVLQPPEKEGR